MSRDDQLRRAGRSPHSAEKRAYALALVRDQGKSVAEAAKEADVPPSTLRGWLKNDTAEKEPARRDWSQRRATIFTAVITVAVTLFAVWLGTRGSSRSAVEADERSKADLVAIHSGVGYLHFRGSSSDVPPDVVLNRSDEDIRDVWVETRDRTGREVDVDMGSVLSCRFEQIGDKTTQGRRTLEALAVHFTIGGRRWSKTSDGVLEPDTSDPPPDLVDRGNHTQDDLDSCGG